MLNEYLSKIKGKTLTKDEAVKLDRYLYENLEEMYTLDVKDVVYIMDLSNEFRLRHLLITLLYNSEIGVRYDFKEEDLVYYIYEHELQKARNLKINGIALGLGDYYLEFNKEEALYYYNDAFNDGLNEVAHNRGYYYSLDKYLTLIDDPLSKLNDLLDYDNIEEENYNLDLIYTMMKRLILMNKEDEKYLDLLSESINITTSIVRDKQLYRNDDNEKLKSDEEKALCEMLCVKLGYLIEHQMYEEAKETDIDLNTEIRESGWNEYKKVRDYYYKK